MDPEQEAAEEADELEMEWHGPDSNIDQKQNGMEGNDDIGQQDMDQNQPEYGKK